MSDFSRRHYKKIAQSIAAVRERWESDLAIKILQDVQDELGDLFLSDNERFKRERFDLACDPSNLK